MTSPTPYDTQRDRYTERVLAFLLDCYSAEPALGSLSVGEVRSFLHYSGAAAFLLPVLATLRDRGLVTLSTGPDGSRTLYFTDKFTSLVGGKP